MKLLSNKYVNNFLRDIIKVAGVYAATKYAGAPEIAGIVATVAASALGFLDKYNNQAPVPANAILAPPSAK